MGDILKKDEKKPQFEGHGFYIRIKYFLLHHFFNVIVELCDFLVELVNTTESDEISDAHGDNANTDQNCHQIASDLHMIESQNTESRNDNAEKHQRPPGAKSNFLKVKALNEDDNALCEHPHSEDDRNGDGYEEENYKRLFSLQMNHEKTGEQA